MGHGDPNNLEDYEGGRDFKALSTFAKENLGPRCGPANLDLCDEGNKTMVEKFMKMDASALQKAIAEKEESMASGKRNWKTCSKVCKHNTRLDKRSVTTKKQRSRTLV